MADKPESHDICFIPDGKYGDFVIDYIPEAARPGPIRDGQGRVLGEHRGIIHYTIGQRHGLGITAPKPLYVTAIEPDRNALIVGSKEEIYSSELIAGELKWMAIPPPEQPFMARARIRYLHPEAEARIIPIDKDKVRVSFNEPQMAVTPGQAVVFYDGDMVLGGGIIERAGS